MVEALIIDDEKPARQAILALGHWSEAGVTHCYEAMEGETGLAILRERRPCIVIVDMKMPGMDGIKFLAIANKEHPQAKYIVISGYDDFEYTRQAIKAKVFDYLLKPVCETELNEAINLAVNELNQESQRQGAELAREILPLSYEVEQSFYQENARFKIAEKNILYEIKNYLDHHYFEEIKLQLFQERYFLSKEYLSKLFKGEFGYNIYEYLLRIRMIKAQEMLSNPEIKVLTISERLGYQDHNYFSRAFKTYYGMTPTEYREKLLKPKKDI